MDGKKGFFKKAEKFLAGKGFYIVLFVCVAVIGASAWVLLSTDTAGNETIVEAGLSGAQYGAQRPSAAPKISDAPPSPTPQVSGDAAGTIIEPEDYESGEITTDADDPGSLENLVFVWPVGGSVEKGYSADALVFSKTMADWRTHEGIDLAAEQGARVMAAADGIVKDVYFDDMYGTTVVIDHGDGLCSVYSNLAGTPTVSGGDSVTMSSVIGSVGNTALAEAVEVSHLHFAMTLNGESVDPVDYLPRK